MNIADKSMPYFDSVGKQAESIQANQVDIAKAARQVEEVFLNELLKTMLQNTELAKGNFTGDFLPFITAEVSKSISKRGIGIQEFLIKSPSFNIMAAKGINGASGDVAKSQLESLKLSAQDAVYKAYGTGMK